jgi:hypothetical protein
VEEIMNFALWSIAFVLLRVLQHRANGFSSSPKEGIRQIFIALKNTSPSAGFEPMNHGFSGKHANS